VAPPALLTVKCFHSPVPGAALQCLSRHFSNRTISGAATGHPSPVCTDGGLAPSPKLPSPSSDENELLSSLFLCQVDLLIDRFRPAMVIFFD